MAKKTSEIVAENMERQKQIDELVRMLERQQAKNADQIAENEARTKAVLDGTSDKLVKETESLTVQPDAANISYDPVPIACGIAGFASGVLLTSLLFYIKLKRMKAEYPVKTEAKKPPVSVASVAALVVSLVSFLMFIMLLNGSAVLSQGYAALWILSGVASVSCPTAAKAIRTKTGSRGKLFEIIAMIIGFFDLNFALMYTTTWNGTFLIALTAIPCVLYSKLFNRAKE